MARRKSPEPGTLPPKDELAKSPVIGRARERLSTNKKETLASTSKEKQERSDALRRTQSDERGRVIDIKSAEIKALQELVEKPGTTDAVRKFSEGALQKLETEIGELIAQDADLSMAESLEEMEEVELGNESKEVIESDIERLISEEEGFEGVLNFSKGHSGWDNYRLNGYTAFIDRVYLGEGTTEQTIIASYLDSPDSLPDILRQQTEQVIKKVIEEKVAREVAESEVPESLKNNFAQSRRDYYTKEATVAEKLSGYISTQDSRRLLLENPEAAKFAIREAVFAKGSLTVRDARRALATFVVSQNDEYRSTAEADEARQKLMESSGREMYGVRKPHKEERVDEAIKHLDQIERTIADMHKAEDVYDEGAFTVEELLEKEYVKRASERAKADVGPIESKAWQIGQMPEAWRLQSIDTKLQAINKEILEVQKIEDPKDKESKIHGLIYKLRQRFSDGGGADGAEAEIRILRSELTNAKAELAELTKQSNGLRPYSPSKFSLTASIRDRAKYGEQAVHLLNARTTNEAIRTHIAEFKTRIEDEERKMNEQIDQKEPAASAEAVIAYKEARKPVEAAAKLAVDNAEKAIAAKEKSLKDAKEAIKGIIDGLVTQYREVKKGKKEEKDSIAVQRKAAEAELAKAEAMKDIWLDPWDKVAKVAVAKKLVEQLKKDEGNAKSREEEAQGQITYLDEGERSLKKWLLREAE